MTFWRFTQLALVQSCGWSTFSSAKRERNVCALFETTPGCKLKCVCVGGGCLGDAFQKHTPDVLFGSRKCSCRHSHQVNSKQEGPDPAACHLLQLLATAPPSQAEQSARLPAPAAAILPTPKGRSIFETTEVYNLMETVFESVGSAQHPSNTTFVPSCAAV